MDISALRERTSSVLTVSELNGYVKNLLEGNRSLSSVTVKGEISNFVNHRNGHFYFSLKDSEGQIRAVMFRSSASSLRFLPENGMKVLAHGSVSVYVRDGAYQLYVSSLQPDGVGALYLAYEQLKERLSAEGLFDEWRKKPIPRYPKAIGVITSPTGAAVRDVMNVLGRRYPLATVYLYPSLVQGEDAEEQLIEGIDYFDRSKLVDTVIICRGGGSIEDLWAFNGEKLARRIASASVPIISGVGHETDFTICDFVADLRAPTPSAAAELAVPDVYQLTQYIDSLSDKATRLLEGRVERMRLSLSRLLARECLKNPESVVTSRMDRLSVSCARLGVISASLLDPQRNSLAVISGKLAALNPLSVLSRGFAFATRSCQGESRTVDSVDGLEPGDEVTVRVSDGSFSASVTAINKEKRSQNEH